MIIIDRPSAWQFASAGSSGISLGAGAAIGFTGGELLLRDPVGHRIRFRYGGFGGGVGAGPSRIRLGRLTFRQPPGVSPVGTALAPRQFPSTGIIYLTNNMRGREATISDFRGPCMFAEAGAGALAGFSGTVMFIGLNPADMAMMTSWWNRSADPRHQGGAVGPDSLIETAKMVLFMASVNVGAQLGGSAMGYMGMIR